MNQYLLRIVAVFLVPCLVGEPVMASIGPVGAGLARASSNSYSAQAPQVVGGVPAREIVPVGSHRMACHFGPVQDRPLQLFTSQALAARSAFNATHEGHEDPTSRTARFIHSDLFPPLAITGAPDERVADEIVARLMQGMADFDPKYTYEHLSRVHDQVAGFIDFLRKNGHSISDKETATILRAALLHDIGKMNIVPSREEAQALLDKPGDLTEDERRLMEEHSAKGSDKLILEGLPEEAKLVRRHHEFFDGTGYPDGLKGEAIPFGSRLIAIADAWDAMTHDRPFNRARPIDDAFRELRKGSATQFDPDLVNAWIKFIDPSAVSAAPAAARLELDLAIREAATVKQPLSVIVIDINNMGNLAARLGRDAANRLLTRVRAGIEEIARELKCRSHLTQSSEDEFYLLLEGSDNAAAIRVGEAIRAFARTIDLGTRGIAPTVSVGIATFPEDIPDAVGLLAAADHCMWLAKSFGGDQIVNYRTKGTIRAWESPAAPPAAPAVKPVTRPESSGPRLDTQPQPGPQPSALGTRPPELTSEPAAPANPRKVARGKGTLGEGLENFIDRTLQDPDCSVTAREYSELRNLSETSARLELYGLMAAGFLASAVDDTFRKTGPRPLRYSLAPSWRETLQKDPDLLRGLAALGALKTSRIWSQEQKEKILDAIEQYIHRNVAPEDKGAGFAAPGAYQRVRDLCPLIAGGIDAVVAGAITELIIVDDPFLKEGLAQVALHGLAGELIPKELLREMARAFMRDDDDPGGALRVAKECAEALEPYLRDASVGRGRTSYKPTLKKLAGPAAKNITGGLLGVILAIFLVSPGCLLFRPDPDPPPESLPTVAEQITPIDVHPVIKIESVTEAIDSLTQLIAEIQSGTAEHPEKVWSQLFEAVDKAEKIYSLNLSVADAREYVSERQMNRLEKAIKKAHALLLEAPPPAASAANPPKSTALKNFILLFGAVGSAFGISGIASAFGPAHPASPFFEASLLGGFPAGQAAHLLTLAALMLMTSLTLYLYGRWFQGLQLADILGPHEFMDGLRNMFTQNKDVPSAGLTPSAAPAAHASNDLLRRSS